MIIDQQELKNILELHRKWVVGEGGTRANLSEANLSEADLSVAYLYEANLSRAYLSEANLSEANLSEADLSVAYLYEANLSRAYLSGANLSGANLSGANLYEANLSRAYLSGANLSGANLSGANLYEANLSGADLSGANLSGANLSGANLSGAYLSGADLSPIRDDLLKVLESSREEVVFLYKALVDGHINGKVYEGDCACLKGTIANARGCNYKILDGVLKADSDSPIEKWFLGIKKGDTPENNPVSAITRDWVVEFMKANDIVVPTRKVVWE